MLVHIPLQCNAASLVHAESMDRTALPADRAVVHDICLLACAGEAWEVLEASSSQASRTDMGLQTCRTICNRYSIGLSYPPM